tara:strand:- start:828 stop:3620 length:2793 start_codon:yes stop_codon:yes gene_type:complete
MMNENEINDTIIMSFLNEGFDSLEDAYFDFLTDGGEIPSEEERQYKAEDLSEEFINNIQNSSVDIGVPKKITDIILEENTVKIGEMSPEKAKNLSTLNALLISNDTQTEFSLSGNIIDDTSKGVDANKVHTYLKKKYKLFQDTKMDRRIKTKILSLVVNALKVKTNVRQFKVKESKTAVVGIDKKNSLKDIISLFSVDGRQLKTINSIHPTRVNSTNITSNKDISNQEYKNMLKELESFNKIHANADEKKRLSPLIQAIKDKLKPIDKIKIMNSGIDRVIGTLSLDKTDNREEIYKFWAEKYKEEITLLESMKIFYEASKKLVKTKGLDKELKKVLQNHNKQYDSIIVSDKDGAVTSSKISYIYKIDTTDSKYVNAMKIKTIDDDDATAISLIFEFIKEVYPDQLLMIDSDFAGMDEDLVDASMTDPRQGKEGQKDESYKDKETGKVVESASIADSSNASDNAIESIEGLSSSILQGVVDPLYYYLITNDKLFVNIGILKKRFNKIKNAIRYHAKVGFRDNDIGFKLLEEYLEKIQGELLLDSNNFQNLFLPITDTLINLFKEVGIEVTDNNTEITLYLKAVEGIINYGENLVKTRPPTVTDINEKMVAGTPVLQYGNVIESRTKGKDLSKLFDDSTSEAFKALIEMINKYYVLPSNSIYLPFNDSPSFSSIVETKFIGTQRDENVADSLRMMQILEFSNAADLISIPQIIGLTKNLNIWNGGIDGSGKNVQELINIANALRKLTMKIFLEEGDVSEDVNIELGASLHMLLEKAYIQKNVKFQGKNTKEWHKKYIETSNSKTWPFNNLMNHIFSHEGQYKEKPEAARSVLRLFEAVDNMPIIKSETELKILEGHDMIRKLMNKKIHFGTYKTHSFEHVNDTLTILKSEYNVELTPFELESIVEEQDAHKNLSVKYGISTDVVYYLKGKFR